MGALPVRAGTRPRTTTQIPHSQLDQQPPDSRHLDQLLDEAGRWPGVLEGESQISVEGARALILADEVPAGPREAFIVGGEFCHGHAQGDHSLHLTLPLDRAAELESAGWAEPHFLALSDQLPRTHVMLYAPRDEAEAAFALEIVRASYDFACGRGPTTQPDSD